MEWKKGRRARRSGGAGVRRAALERSGGCGAALKRSGGRLFSERSTVAAALGGSSVRSGEMCLPPVAEAVPRMPPVAEAVPEAPRPATESGSRSPFWNGTPTAHLFSSFYLLFLLSTYCLLFLKAL